MRAATTEEWGRTLGPWRRASALIAAMQTPAMVAAIVLVFFGRESTHVWGAVAAAAVVLLDVVQWGLARAALRLVPPSFAAQVHASRPLDRGERRLVSFGLLAGLATPVVLLVVMPDTSFFAHHLGAAAVLLIASETPSLLSLHRVWRHDTWLAVSRIPARPRQSHPRYRGPDAT